MMEREEDWQMWRFFLLVTLLALSLTGATCTRREPRQGETAGKSVTPAPPFSVSSSVPSPTQAAASPAAKAAEEDLFLDLEAEPDYAGPPPFTVRFVLEVEDAVPPLKYDWDFGDGSPKSHEANPTHVFEKEGEYTTVVTVTDSRGVSAREDIDIYVEKEE